MASRAAAFSQARKRRVDMQTQTTESSARLLNAVAIVTGGASGIGHGIALEFAREGAAVAILDLNRVGAEGTVQEIQKEGGKAVAVTADVTDSGQVEAAVRSAAAQLGEASVLVNCAGFNQLAPANELPAGLWEKIRAINLDGPWYCANAVMPAMIRRRAGKILNIASGVAILAAPNSAPYCAAKAGLIGLTRALALDLAPYGINVNCVCPGSVNTPLVQQAMSPAFLQKLVEITPFARLATPRDIAQATVFLCSSDANYITGVVLPVDGGLTC